MVIGGTRTDHVEGLLTRVAVTSRLYLGKRMFTTDPASIYDDSQPNDGTMLEHLPSVDPRPGGDAGIVTEDNQPYQVTGFLEIWRVPIDKRLGFGDMPGATRGSALDQTVPTHPIHKGGKHQ
jgi:hypothetical protein